MTPIDDREFGILEERVKTDHENVALLFDKMDRLADKFDSYVKAHGAEHDSIAGQLGGVRQLWALVLLAVGASVTAAIAAIFKG